MPSEYIKDHCVWGFLSDPVGIRRRDAGGTSPRGNETLHQGDPSGGVNQLQEIR